MTGNKILDYAPWASVMWWFLVQDDATCLNDADLHSNILKPDECHSILVAVKAAGFKSDSKEYGSFVTQAQAFVTQQKLADTVLQAQHLEAIDPAPVLEQPTPPHEYITELKIRDLADSTSGSYGPLGLFEFFAAPRLTTSSRFDLKMPFMLLGYRVVGLDLSFKSLIRLHSKYNVDLSERLNDGELIGDDDMQDIVKALVGDFFSNINMPLSMISMAAKTFAGKCTQRSFLFNAIASWQFVPSSRDATFSKYFISVVQSFSEIAAVVLPAPSAAIARLSTEQLVAALIGQTAPLSMATLASAQSKLLATSLAAEVKLPENAAKQGTEKLQMFLSKVALNMPPSMQSVGSTSTSTVSGKSELSMTPETQTWLNSKQVMQLERKLATCFGTTPPSYHAAIMAVSRSRMPLIIQMLTSRSSLGKSEVLKRGKELRTKLKSAIAFAVSAHEDTSTDPATLKQHDRLIQYDQHMPEILLQAAYGSSKGDFAAFDPIVITKSIEQLLTRRKSTRATVSRVLRWADVEVNSAVATYLDRYFHMLGWNNGCFSDFMKRPNKMLTQNTSLPPHEKLVLKKKVSAAVLIGLSSVGDEWRTMLQAESHTAPFPHDGKSLVPNDSACFKELDYLQERIDKLDDTHFWDADDDELEAPPKKQHRGTTSNEECLKNEIKGDSHHSTHAITLIACTYSCTLRQFPCNTHVVTVLLSAYA